MAEQVLAAAAAGVPVRTGPLPRVVRHLLGADLADAVEAVTPADLADPVARAARTRRARRAALAPRVVPPTAITVVLTDGARVLDQRLPPGWPPVRQVTDDASDPADPAEPGDPAGVTVRTVPGALHGPHLVVDAVLDARSRPAGVLVAAAPRLTYLTDVDVWVLSRTDSPEASADAAAAGPPTDVVRVAGPAERDVALRDAERQWSGTPAALGEEWGPGTPWDAGRSPAFRSWFETARGPG